MLVAQIDGGEPGILLTPLCDVGFVALVALEEMVFAEVGEDVCALLGHEHAGVFGIGEVDLGDLLGEVLIVGVELGHQAAVERHAPLARGGRVAGIDAGDDGEGVVMRGHGGGRHVEQNAVGVDEADLLAVARKGHGLAFNDVDANLIGEHAHDGGVLDPGDGFKLLAALADGNKEDVAADVFAEDGEHLGAGDFSEAGGLDVAGAGDAEAGVAFEIGLEEVAGGAEAGEDEERAERQRHAPDGAGRTPPVGGRGTEDAPI